MKRLERLVNVALVPALIFGGFYFVWWIIQGVLKAIT